MSNSDSTEPTPQCEFRVRATISGVEHEFCFHLHHDSPTCHLEKFVQQGETYGPSAVDIPDWVAEEVEAETGREIVER